jgi:hypothetical protein
MKNSGIIRPVRSTCVGSTTPRPITGAEITLDDGSHLTLLAETRTRSEIKALAARFDDEPELRALALAIAAERGIELDEEASDKRLIRALLDVIQRGGDEALMLDPGGFVSSCNATNFFWVKDGEVRTSTGEFCFNGVTRGNVIKLCGANAIPIKLDYFPLRDVHAAEEAFVTGTFGGLTPVRAVDGHVMPAGTPGPVTQRLRELYEVLKDGEVR